MELFAKTKFVQLIFCRHGSRSVKAKVRTSLASPVDKAVKIPDRPNINKHKILLEGVDYSFVDGRPVPYGSRQLQRAAKQKQYTADIVRLTQEMDFAMDRYRQRVRESEEAKQKILDDKLKEKGKQLVE